LDGSVRPLNQAQRPLCVGEGDFVVAGAHRCAEANQKLAAFGEVLPRATESGFAVQLVEPADYSADQAKLAAIQRLLALAGYEAEPIDGVSGPRTDAALAMFLRERGLAAETAASPAFLDLLMDAVREGAGRGLLWCNETTHVVMAALAVEEKGSVVARGWWRIEPGACVRPDLSRRAGARVYSFAEAVDGTGGAVERAGKPLSWGGSKRLCVRNSRFEISEHDECPARGLSMHGFAAVDLSQRSGATVRFREP
jgi:uncharacterized membrane protein